MTPQFDLDALRKAAESLKPAPQKRYAPRNSQPYSATIVPGASVFASTPDDSSSSNNSSSYSEPSARVPPHLNSSNIRFQPPLTPLVVPPSLEPSELSPSSLPAALTPTTPQSDQSSLEIEFSLSTPDLPTYSPSTRAPRLTSKYEKIHQILSDLRTQQISPIDLIIQVLNPSDASYERYRANLYAERSSKITQLLDTIMADDAGKEKLLQFLQPRLEGLACDFVAEEMEQRQKASTLKGIDVVDPDFIENWSIDEDVDTTPFLTAILLAASQTDRARKENKLKKADQMCRVVTRQLLYQRSNRCLAFQAEFGLFLWSTGCARQTIDALFRCGISVSYDSVLHCIQALATHCIRQSIQVATEPHVFCYDNINLSTSIFVEQRGAAGPAKVTSGTFGVLYKLRNARAVMDRNLLGSKFKCSTTADLICGGKLPESASTGTSFGKRRRRSIREPQAGRNGGSPKRGRPAST